MSSTDATPLCTSEMASCQSATCRPRGGGSAPVTLAFKGKVFRAIAKRRRAKVLVALEASSPAGSSKATTKIKLTAKKKGKG